jgi:hypothetical protein
MATSYKFLTTNDKIVSTSNLEQSASLGNSSSYTGTRRSFYTEIASGTVGHIFDITFGRSSTLPLSGSDASKEKNIYNQMSKLLLGTDSSNNILKFSLDEDANQTNNLLHAAYFMNFSRGQTQDKIKVGSFNMKVRVNDSAEVILRDSGSNGYELRDCLTGQYGIIYASASAGYASDFRITASLNQIQGLLFYEAGIAVISPFIFAQSGSQAIPSASYANFAQNSFGILANAVTGNFSSSTSYVDTLTGSLIGDSAYGLQTKISSLSFQSATELNSSIIFCRAYNNEFNFSSNPTYLSASQIIVKGGEPTNPPVSYITTVGLYDDKNQLLAVAKLSEPIKKTPDTELIARVRLDF